MTSVTEPRMFGAFSGHSGYGKHEDCDGIDIGLLLTAVLGIGAAFFALLTKITMIGRRKKRDVDSDLVGEVVDNLHHILLSGEPIIIPFM